jgi:hypothetical protein
MMSDLPTVVALSFFFVHPCPRLTQKELKASQVILSSVLHLIVTGLSGAVPH